MTAPVTPALTSHAMSAKSGPGLPIVTPEARVPQPGDIVEFRGSPGTVVKVRPTGLIDLVVYGPGGKPLAFDRLEHGLSPNNWKFPGEGPPPAPTLDQLLDAAEARGERVPRPGMEVVYMYEGERDGPRVWTDIKGRRAKVVRVLGTDEAELEVYANQEPPLDPDDPDPVWRVVRARHDPEGIHAERFAYSGEFAARGRTRTSEARPRWRCTRPNCSKPADPGFILEVAGREPTRVCQGCKELWAGLVTDYFAGRAVASA